MTLIKVPEAERERNREDQARGERLLGALRELQANGSDNPERTGGDSSRRHNYGVA